MHDRGEPVESMRNDYDVVTAMLRLPRIFECPPPPACENLAVNPALHKQWQGGLEAFNPPPPKCLCISKLCQQYSSTILKGGGGSTRNFFLKSFKNLYSYGKQQFKPIKRLTIIGKFSVIHTHPPIINICSSAVKLPL